MRAGGVLVFDKQGVNLVLWSCENVSGGNERLSSVCGTFCGQATYNR